MLTNPHGIYADSIREIAYELDWRRHNHGPRIILITSAQQPFSFATGPEHVSSWTYTHLLGSSISYTTGSDRTTRFSCTRLLLATS